MDTNLHWFSDELLLGQTGRRSALSKCFSLCIFMTYILGHSQGPKIMRVIIIVTIITVRPDLVTSVDIF